MVPNGCAKMGLGLAQLVGHLERELALETSIGRLKGESELKISLD